jgi:hypothetical protein
MNNSSNNKEEKCIEMITGGLPQLITVKELANILHCGYQQVYRYVYQGYFDGAIVKIGNSRTLRFNLTKIINQISKGEIAAGSC